MSKKYRLNKKKFISRILILVLLIALIIFIINIFNKPVDENKEASNNNQTIEANTNETKSSESTDNNATDNNMDNTTEVAEDNNTPKKIDFLENVKGPVYKKSEKNIKIPILIYHEFFTPIPEDDVYHLFSNQENFEENVTTLLNDGYTFITLEDLYRYNNGEIGLPEKVVIITMDDGWLGNYLEAFPVLKKYNVPATIFIVNDLVGTRDYFSWEQAKEMYDSGLVKIHCHGYKHISYGNVSKETLISDYTKSHQEIEEHLGEKQQKIMAYPAGDSSANSIKWLKEIGFEIQVQTKYGTVNKSRDLDLTGLGRIRAERATGSSILATINAAGV